MKIKLLSAVILLSLTACSEAPESTPESTKAEISNVVIMEKVSDKVEVLEVKNNKVEPVKNNSILSEYKDYSKINLKAKDPELQKLIDQTVVEYEESIEKIVSQIDSAISDTKNDYQDNLKELNAILVTEKTSYEKECKEVTSKNGDLCNHKGKTVNDLKNKISQIENNLENELKKMENKKLNSLKKYQNSFENNIGNLLSQDR